MIIGIRQKLKTRNLGAAYLYSQGHSGGPLHFSPQWWGFIPIVSVCRPDWHISPPISQRLASKTRSLCCHSNLCRGYSGFPKVRLSSVIKQNIWVVPRSCQPVSLLEWASPALTTQHIRVLCSMWYAKRTNATTVPTRPHLPKEKGTDTKKKKKNTNQ